MYVNFFPPKILATNNRDHFKIMYDKAWVFLFFSVIYRMWTIFFGIVIGWCMLDVIVVEAVWNRLFVEGVKEFVMKASQQECYHNDRGSNAHVLNAIVLGFLRMELWRFTYTKIVSSLIIGFGLIMVKTCRMLI